MLSLKQNDKDLSALELEKVVKDLKGLLKEYKRMNNEKDMVISQRESEIDHLNQTIGLLESQINGLEQKQRSAYAQLDSAVFSERTNSTQVQQRLSLQLRVFEEEKRVLESALQEKGRYIVELECSCKDIDFARQQVESKQTLIESLRRENQVLLQRLKETFRQNAIDSVGGFNFEEERQFALDIIKKKEAQGYFSEGFLSSEPPQSMVSREQAYHASYKEKALLEESKRIRAEHLSYIDQQEEKQFKRIPDTSDKRSLRTSVDSLAKEGIKWRQLRMEQERLAEKYLQQQ